MLNTANVVHFVDTVR